MSACSRCNSSIAVGQRFCPQCGAPVFSASAETKTEVAVSPETIGVTCPYCRFPVKEGGAIYTCPECKAVHHSECWQDNGGCCITGCAAGPSPAARTQSAAATVRSPAPRFASPSQAPAVAPRAGRQVPLAAAAAVVALVLILGAGVAIAVSSSGGRPPASSAPSGAVPQKSSATTAPRSSSETSATEGAGRGTTPNGAIELVPYDAASYSAELPRGWTMTENELQRPSESESRWSGDTGLSDYVLIDLHTPTHLAPEQDAEPVHKTLEESRSYHEISYEPGDLAGRNSWMWVFDDEGSERIDYLRDPLDRSGCCESFDGPVEWVEGAISCRDAGIRRSRSSGS